MISDQVPNPTAPSCVSRIGVRTNPSRAPSTSVAYADAAFFATALPLAFSDTFSGSGPCVFGGVATIPHPSLGARAAQPRHAPEDIGGLAAFRTGERDACSAP